MRSEQSFYFKKTFFMKRFSFMIFISYLKKGQINTRHLTLIAQKAFRSYNCDLTRLQGNRRSSVVYFVVLITFSTCPKNTWWLLTL